VLYAITRMPGNPITGRGSPISPLGLAIEVMQAAFIGLSIVIIICESRRKRISGRNAAEAA
jgi:hypothetical protein